MNYLEYVMDLVDAALDTKQKRHITGGVLLSLSLLFGSLACTVITIKTEGENNDEKDK